MKNIDFVVIAKFLCSPSYHDTFASLGLVKKQKLEVASTTQHKNTSYCIQSNLRLLEQAFTI